MQTVADWHAEGEPDDGPGAGVAKPQALPSPRPHEERDSAR